MDGLARAKYGRGEGMVDSSQETTSNKGISQPEREAHPSCKPEGYSSEPPRYLGTPGQEVKTTSSGLPEIQNNYA